MGWQDAPIVGGAPDPDQQQARLRLGVSQPVQPDRHAEVMGLAARANLPTDIVERNFDQIQELQKRRELPVAEMQRQTPQTADWLAENKDNGAVAADDLPRLGWLEWMLTAPGKAFRQGQAQVRAGELRYRSIFGDLSWDDSLTMAESEAELKDADLGEETWFGKALTGGARQLPQLIEQTRRGTETGLKVGMTLGAGTAIAGQLGPQVALPEELATVPVATATGFGIGMLSESAQFGFEQEAGHAYSEFLQFVDEEGNRIDPGAAKLAALAAGGLNSGLEAVGLGILLKSIPGAEKLVGPAGRAAVRRVLQVPTVRAALADAAKSYAGTLVKESAVEVTQRAVTIMAGELAKVASGAETQGAGDIAADLGREGVGALQAFTFLSAPGPMMQAGLGVREAQKAQQRQQFFESLGEGVKESKLAERLPDKLQELAQRITADGPLATVYIPAADWQTMFQAKELDPGRAAEEVLGSREAYDEAVSIGTDIPVPLSVYAAKLAPTEMNAELAKVVRLRPGEMNAVEAEQFMAEQEKEAAENAVPREPDPVDAIREDITGQLVASGYERSTAEAMAEVQASFYNAQAVALGVSPADLFARFRPSVNLEIPEVLRQVGSTDQIDNLLDRYRLGQVPDQKEAYGESLTEFITRLGGIKPDERIDRGELQARNLTRQGKGFKPLVNKGATKNLEKMAEAAFEAGYIAEYDFNQMLDAIDQELSGQPVYSERPIDGATAGNEQARQQRDLFDQIGRWLDEQGIDIATATNAEIKAKLQQAQGQTLEQDGPQVLYQDGDRDLIVQHNLSEENLLHSARMGGIPVPSLAITKAESPITGFGEITLLGDPAMADPKGYAGAKVFGADVYSPRYPDIQVKLSSNALNELNRRLKPYLQQDEPSESGGWRAPRTRSFYGSDITKADDLTSSKDFKAWAAEHGVPDGNYHGLRKAAEELLRDVGAEERIFRGFTDSGNRRYTPHTLENVVKILKKELRGGEGFNYGVGSLRAKYTEQFRSVSQIKKAKDRLVTKEQFEAVKKEVDEEFWSIANDLAEYHPAHERFGFGDTVISTLQDAATMGLRRALKENGFEGDIQDDLLKDIGEYLVKLRNLPTEYFEAKILREVDLAEFRVAVAPSTISDEARRILEGRGLKVVTYERGNVREEAQAKAVSEAAKQFSDTVMFQPADGSAAPARGSVTFPADRSRFDIRLMKDANLSTFLHESGHQFLEIMGVLAQEDAQGNSLVAEDYATLLEWFGVESRDKITREHHEQFARGFEAYLMEGKAPSSRLRAVFAKFRAWLVGIYRSVKGLNVELTPEVRGVMDRMLATDDEIKAAEQEASVVPLWATAEDAGMTAPEFAAYQSTVQAASEQARDKLQAKVMAQLNREQQKWWQEERGKLRAVVAEEVDRRPEYVALSILQKAVLPDGTPAQPIKFSKAGLEALYGKVKLPKKGQTDFQPNVVMNRLRDLRVWDKEQGLAPDVVASVLGFGSTDELVMALVNARPREALIEAETDRRMLETYPDVRFDGSLAQEAEVVVNGEGRETVLRAELAALRKKVREVRPFVRVAEQAGAEALRDQQQATSQAARAQRDQQRQAQRGGLRAIRTATPQPELLRQVARQIIAGKKVRDINPESYLATARWQARKAVEAAAMGDKAIKPDPKKGLPGYASGWEWAADLKQRELLNHYLYREASDAREQVAATLEWVKRANAKPSRDRMAKAGYLEQWDNILERFSFKRTTARKADQRTSLAVWVEAQEEAGLPVNIAPHVLDEARRESYVNLTMEELLGLRDALKQIQRFARLVTKLTAAKDKREWEQAKAALLERVKVSTVGGKAPPISPFEETGSRQFGRAVGEIADSHLRPETLIEWLDGGTSGPWHDFLWEAANRAEYGRESLRKQVIAPLQKIADGMTRTRSRELEQAVPIRSLGMDLNRRTLISMALNMGNEGNLQRLMQGGIREGDGVRQLTEANIEEVKAALTADDWQMVQTIWDTIDQLWPQIRDFEERLTGQAPPRVEATPVVTAHGTFRGGYYPVVYDPHASKIGEKQADSGANVEKMFANFTQATTGKGHTKARTGVAGPLYLNFAGVITRHLDQVITDLTHREFVIDALKILNDREIKAALLNRQGVMARASLMAMVRHAVHSDYGFNDAAGRVLSAGMRRASSNLAVAALGFKVVTAFGNLVLAPIQAAARVNPLSTLRGFGQFYRHPKDMTDFIRSRSEMMRHRTDNLDDSMVTVLQRLRGQKGARAQVARAAMSVHWAADWITSHAIWLARYQDALTDGATETDAVRLADKAIRTTQTAGAPKDLSAIERNPMLRETGLNMFMGPLVIMGNRIREAVQQRGAVKNWPEAAGVLFAAWFLPAIVWELATGKDPDGEDDDKSIPAWALRKVISYPFQGVPIVRDVASLLEAKAAGTYSRSRTLPVLDAAEVLIRAGSTAMDAGTELWEGGDPDGEKLTKDGLRALGLAYGLPTGQAAITGEFLRDVMVGDFSPETPLDWRYLVVQRPKELRD